MSGKETMVCSTAFDMWSFGAIMYEIYVGKRFFDESLHEEEIVSLLCSVSL
jgi:multidrug transporter EmrE-like cation transporter